MKKALLFILFPFLASSAMAQIENYSIPRTSYSEVATPSAVLFTSAPIQFVGISISSPSPNSLIAIYRSTSAAFTADIGSQTTVSTSYFNSEQPVFIPLFDMMNTSYTYINKVGTADVTIWFRCASVSSGVGLCPGLRLSGQR